MATLSWNQINDQDSSISSLSDDSSFEFTEKEIHLSKNTSMPPLSKNSDSPFSKEQLENFQNHKGDQVWLYVRLAYKKNLLIESIQAKFKILSIENLEQGCDMLTDIESAKQMVKYGFQGHNYKCHFSYSTKNRKSVQKIKYDKEITNKKNYSQVEQGKGYKNRFNNNVEKSKFEGKKKIKFVEKKNSESQKLVEKRLNPIQKNIKQIQSAQQIQKASEKEERLKKNGQTKKKKYIAKETMKPKKNSIEINQTHEELKQIAPEKQAVQTVEQAERDEELQTNYTSVNQHIQSQLKQQIQTENKQLKELSYKQITQTKQNSIKNHESPQIMKKQEAVQQEEKIYEKKEMNYIKKEDDEDNSSEESLRREKERLEKKKKKQKKKKNKQKSDFDHNNRFSSLMMD